MTQNEPPHDAERSDARSLTAPEDVAGGPALKEERAAEAAASWENVKNRLEPQVRQAGFDGIPEPDSADFPHFLARLNAKNGPLALELVAATHRLRQEVDMPSSRAAQRRERKRATRRLLFMRQTPDGRWVADKSKAPVYGMTGLLLLGSLLTAVYALPRLNGTSVIATTSETTPAATETDAPITPGRPTGESEAALKKSREELARFRAEKAAQEDHPTPPLSGPSSGSEADAASNDGSGAGGLTGGVLTNTGRSTTSFQPLSTEPNPPAPPVVQERSVQVPDSTPPAVFSPVSSAPAPQTYTAPATYTPSATYAPPQDSFGGFEPDPLPVTSTPVRVTPAPAPARTPPATAARPVTSPRPTATSTAAARPAASATPVRPPARTSEAPDVSASFGALPVMPPPVDAAAPVASSSPAEASSTGASGTPSTPAVSTMSFGNVQDTAPVTAPPPSDTAGFSSGVVYERAARTAVASAAASSGAGGTLAAETPFGSDASNPASKIGATGPFKPLEQVPAILMTAIRTPNGGSVPVVAVTPDGGSFVGLATINATLARVDMQFRRYVAADGKIYAIDALAYSRDPGGLTQGLAAEIQAVAPTLALDAAQNSANALNTYVQNVAATAAKNQGTSINLGDNLTLSGPSVANLAQTLLGGLGSTFRMPENSQSITRIATVKGSIPMIVIAGLGGEGR